MQNTTNVVLALSPEGAVYIEELLKLNNTAQPHSVLTRTSGARLYDWCNLTEHDYQKLQSVLDLFLRAAAQEKDYLLCNNRTDPDTPNTRGSYDPNPFQVRVVKRVEIEYSNYKKEGE